MMGHCIDVGVRKWTLFDRFHNDAKNCDKKNRTTKYAYLHCYNRRCGGLDNGFVYVKKDIFRSIFLVVTRICGCSNVKKIPGQQSDILGRHERWSYCLFNDVLRARRGAGHAHP